MNEYITLDSLKYPTLSTDWTSHLVVPSSDAMMLNGEVAVTFGPAARREWNGSIKAEVTARDTGWGTIADLRTTLAKLTTLSFTDHYSSSYTVLVQIAGPEISLSPMWDATSNEFAIKVKVKQVT